MEKYQRLLEEFRQIILSTFQCPRNSSEPPSGHSEYTRSRTELCLTLNKNIIVPMLAKTNKSSFSAEKGKDTVYCWVCTHVIKHDYVIIWLFSSLVMFSYNA